MTDKLTLNNAAQSLIKTDNAELGDAIHSEALQREKKAREDKVIAEVQRLESTRLEYVRKAAFATEAANWYAAKLDAVQTGAFDFDLVHGQMIFHDARFNQANY